MTTLLEKALARYGQTVTVTHDGVESTTKAFLEPETKSDWTAPYAVTALGMLDDRRWICLTGTALWDGDTVAGEQGVWTVQSCAPYYLGEAPSHWWAVLAAKKEAAQ